MTYRIITHGGCSSMDGFASAFIFKKYIAPLLKLENESFEIIGLNPPDVQTGNFEFTEFDIVLDLPQPKTKVFFWCDHHLTAKPEPESSLPENYYWEEVPSCAGYLIDIATKLGLKPSKELLEFKEGIDMMDGALYTPEIIKTVYYKQANYNNPTPIQKVHIISSLFHTNDSYLNEEIFMTLLNNDLPETPISEGKIWTFHPFIFYNAELRAYQDWRVWVETFIELQEDAKTVIIDYRKPEKYSKGSSDRFYSYLKFPEAASTITIKTFQDGNARLGIGCNIFHKEWNKVNIGKLCNKIARKFGEGAGGGHFGVGGCTIAADNADAAVQFALEEFKKNNS